MKRLILVRHAKTEQIYDYSKSDFDRKLLPRGHKDSAIVANQLKQKGLSPDLFVTSKAKRALETAEIYANILDFPPEDIQKEQFIYDGYTTSQMIDFIGGFDNNKETAIIFGHNPNIASFIVNLIPEDLWHFPTSCTTVINFNVENWDEIEAREGKMELYIYPKMFK
ncbi:phosphoglycerate mutase [Labilibacter sediminis]|nr:phosphoglycerate mutase [Labilibacter sediminis]